MTVYTVPLHDMQCALKEIANLPLIVDNPRYAEVTEDIVAAIFHAAATFAQQELAPLNQPGDQYGVSMVNGKVQTPRGFANAYRHFVQQGWPSLPAPQQYGGQGLPYAINAVVMEMVMSANLAFSLCPMLTQGAIKTIDAYGNDTLKQRFLPAMTAGHWTGAMDLTEPQAGSDLSAVSTQAFPEDDHYRIRGQKIFISWGDHDMADNVIHLVLARLAGAPAGVKGLSLFVVPQYMVNPDGTLGEPNDIITLSVEKKLGLHASPTCVLSYGDNRGAVGYLLGEENQGLACMFTMMNHARINVGMQGLGLAERAYQQATAYTQERTQSGGPIAHIPDVYRMRMLMRTGCAAMRAMIYFAMGLSDQCETYNLTRKTDAEKRLQLLTPLVKSWCTDLTQEITGLNIQIHGGMGFIEETGAAQFYRDARVLPIYEGTNGIQAIDFVDRKILSDQGITLMQLYAEINVDIQQFHALPMLSAEATHLENAVAKALACTTQLINNHRHLKKWRATACYLVDLHAYCLGAWLLCKKTMACSHQQKNYGIAFAEEQRENSRFYCQHYLPRVYGLAESIQSILKSPLTDSPE